MVHRRYLISASILALAALLAACGGNNSTATPTASSVIPATSHLRSSASGQKGKPSFKCFVGGGGKCTITSSGAILDNTVLGSYAGVNITSTNKLAGTLLSQLTAFGFTYSGTLIDGSSPAYPSGGGLRFSIPTNIAPSPGSGDTQTEVYAFVYAQECPTGNGSIETPESSSNGTVDAINGDWCKEMNTYQSPAQYWELWTDFTSNWPTAKIVGDHGPLGYPFIVADADAGMQGIWTITNVQLGK